MSTNNALSLSRLIHASLSLSLSFFLSLYCYRCDYGFFAVSIPLVFFSSPDPTHRKSLFEVCVRLRLRLIRSDSSTPVHAMIIKIYTRTYIHITELKQTSFLSGSHMSTPQAHSPTGAAVRSRNYFLSMVPTPSLRLHTEGSARAEDGAILSWTQYPISPLLTTANATACSTDLTQYLLPSLEQQQRLSEKWWHGLASSRSGSTFNLAPPPTVSRSYGLPSASPLWPVGNSTEQHHYPEYSCSPHPHRPLRIRKSEELVYGSRSAPHSGPRWVVVSSANSNSAAAAPVDSPAEDDRVALSPALADEASLIFPTSAAPATAHSRMNSFMPLVNGPSSSSEVFSPSSPITKHTARPQGASENVGGPPADVEVKGVSCRSFCLFVCFYSYRCMACVMAVEAQREQPESAEKRR
eukprot:gene6343-4570_t